MKEKWFIKNKQADFDLLASTYQIDPILARLIVNRGVSSMEEMEGYLNPSAKGLHSPYLMKDMEKTCRILMEKIQEGRPIRIIGDYDVDGVMSTYILLKGLSNCKANADYEIPDRIKDGYGINMELMKAAIADGIDTVITCDNGIAAREPIVFGKSQGLTVLVTDHHDIPIEEGVPDADAVVNPKQEDCGYPFKGICGALVAFKLVQVLYEKKGFPEEKIWDLLPFAAIATVCDVMDLVDENRIIVKLGLEKFKEMENPGLKHLAKECGLLGKDISAYHFGFILGPCINASGRLESAKTGLRMLLEKEEEKAAALAEELKKLNDERKAMTQEWLLKAIELVDTGSLFEDKVLVVYLPDCHESLAGIIAGRLRERYNRPVIVLTKGENIVKGSGRSIEEYNMFEQLSECRELLTKFGGHPMAAGLSLSEDKIQSLRHRLNEITALTEEDLTRKVSFDMVLPLEKISMGLIHQIERLEPYGKGNAKPLFALKDVEIVRGQVLGASQNVLKLTVKTPSSRGNMTAMVFQNILSFEEAAEEKYGPGAYEEMLAGRRTITMDLVFSLNINTYNGMDSIQLVVQNFR